MKEQLLMMLLNMVFGMMTKENLKAFADLALDFVEDKVIDSSNTWDDKIVLPICERVRDAFDIEDND